MITLQIKNSAMGFLRSVLTLGLPLTFIVDSFSSVHADQTYGVSGIPSTMELASGVSRRVNIGSWCHHDTIAGKNFFDSFTFINRWDNTSHSAAYYVDRKTAQELSLAYVDNNDRAIIAVDTSVNISNDTMPAVLLNTTDGTYKYNETALRKSIRLESLERHDAGTLVIADFHHAPYGCASWPAFWMYGQNWPENGEIDIFEGWNDNDRNQAALHTSHNCSHDPTGIQTGKLIQETCDSSVNYNAGCAVQDPSTHSYGQPFNNGGGGVFAAMYTNSEISVWRWRRQEVPTDIKDNKPRPELWHKPVATWKNGASCHINQKFGPQNLVFTIALCGDADLNTYKQGKCPGTCYEHFLKGAHYKEVYFAVNSINIFKGDPDAVSRPERIHLSPPS